MSVVQIDATTIFDRFDDLKKSVESSLAAQSNASTDRSAEILKKLEFVEQKFVSIEAKIEKVIEDSANRHTPRSTHRQISRWKISLTAC